MKVRQLIVEVWVETLEFPPICYAFHGATEQECKDRFEAHKACDPFLRAMHECGELWQKIGGVVVHVRGRALLHWQEESFGDDDGPILELSSVTLSG